MSGPASLERCANLPPHCGRLVALAARDPRRAVRLAQVWHARAAGAPLDQALAAYLLGYALLCHERLDQAEGFLDQAEAHLRGCEAHRLTLDVWRARLFVALLRGGGAGHAEEWSGLAASYEQMGCPLSAARSRLAQMAQLNNQGLARAALDLADAVGPALARWGAPGDQAWLRRIAGLAHADLGAFDQALRGTAEAADIFAALRQRGELAKTWLARSYIYSLQGDLDQCVREIERALPVCIRLDLPLRVAFCTKNLGLFAALRGEYDRAILLTLQAADRFALLGRRDALADCDLNLGNIAYYAGLSDLALAAYRRAGVVYSELDQRGMGLRCHRNQALVLRAQGRPEEALRLLDELLPVAELLGEQVEAAETIHARGQALADLSRPRDAARDFEDAEERFRSLTHASAAGESLLERGWLLVRQGDLAPAETCILAARPLLETRPIHQWRADYALGRCAEARGDLV
ncbi:MAG: tetratricopeptide repeat protein, partial [Chloroflexales bacterium]|nr:tetratricopeptide repeat protein [Chloroflexales bacterium]